MRISFQPLLEVAQCVQPSPLVFLDPTFIDLVERNRIEVMQLFSPPADRRHQVGSLESREVLRDRLAGHVEVRAEVPQRLAVLRSEAVEQTPSCGTGERLENFVHATCLTICK